MPMKNNRLLLELEQAMRTINQDIINPEIPELTLKKLNPVLKMVAQVRAAYLNTLFEMAQQTEDKLPSTEQIDQLRTLRLTYDECVAGAQAMETAIQRGYLDVRKE